MTKPTCLFSGILLLLAVIPAAHAIQNPSADKILQSLNTALSAEQNAEARYLAFAAKADEEGYGESASLFRAAAKAEQFHARNFAQEITKLGGTHQVKTEAPAVKSTKENLEAAIQAETYESDTMYPELRRLAQDLYEMDALRTINYAYNGEVSHLTLFKEAYNNLGTTWGTNKMYYVCSECGYTTKDGPKRACHACYSPEEEFEQVS